MSLRRGLLALAATIAVAGGGMAQEPVKPLVEGREPDPVVLRFHGVEPPTFGYGSGPVAPAPRAAFGFELSWSAVDFLCDLFPNHFTMPLGTVPMWD
jgi:hypothetical protein